MPGGHLEERHIKKKENNNCIFLPALEPRMGSESKKYHQG